MGKISDYTRVLAAKLADVFVVDQTDNGTTETKSATVEQIGTAIGTLQNFADLDTSNKSLVDAINEIAGYTPVYGNTASGAIATFDTSLALPLQDLQIAINAVQTGTLPPSPSNVCPISGFTGANIHVADDETPHIIDNVTAITWQTEAGTVYGGSLDVTSGVLTVTHAITTLDGSQGSSSFRVSAKTGYTQTEWYDYRAIGIIGATIISDKFFSTDGIPTVLYGVGGSPNGERCFFGLPDTVTTTAEANTWFENNPTVIVYPIATPTTYQLTPTQISAIVGTNNVFTDTNGDTSVVYACSLKDYIDSQ